MELIRGATVYDLPIESMKLVEIGFEQGDYRHLRVMRGVAPSSHITLRCR